MTTINTNTSINQAWIDANAAPWTLTAGVTVTLTGDLNLTNAATHYFILNSGCTLFGRGYKIFINMPAASFSGISRTSGGSLANPVTLKQIGVVAQGSTSLLGNAGALLYNNSITYTGNTYIFYNCYYNGDITNSCGGALMGRVPSNSKVYVYHCYSLGSVTGTNAGGLIGCSDSSFFNLTEIIYNSYHIGGVSGTNAGAIIGSYAGQGLGYLYVFNTYWSDGNLTGISATSPSLIATCNTYNYNNNWGTPAPTVTLGNITNTYFTTQANWTIIDGVWSVTPLNTFIATLGIPSTTSGFFDFGAGEQPYGLTDYITQPYISSHYPNASSNAANCFCKGTKITIVNSMGKREQLEIENVMQGMNVYTPRGEIKKVLHVGKMWYTGHNQDYNPYLIPKDYYGEGIPFEDTYASGKHCLLYSRAQADLLSIDGGRMRDPNKVLCSYQVSEIGQKQDYQHVCLIKGENNNPYGFYYYHLVVEDNAGFFANGLQSESLGLRNFQKHFEEINKVEEVKTL